MDLEWLAELPPWEWPLDEARTALRSTLLNREEEDERRRLAAELAGNIVVMDDDLAEALLSVVVDPDAPDELRGSAAIALGPVLEELWMEFDLDDPLVSDATGARIRAILRDTYRDPAQPKYVRRRALEASIRGPEDWHAGAVRAAFREEDDEWRLTGAFGMQFVPGFEKEILEALESPERDVRYHAVRAAGSWDVPESWPVIRDILRTEDDKGLLLAAIEAAINHTTDPDRLADTVGGLIDHPDSDISQAALDGLATAEAIRDAAEGDEGDETDGTR